MVATIVEASPATSNNTAVTSPSAGMIVPTTAVPPSTIMTTTTTTTNTTTVTKEKKHKGTLTFDAAFRKEATATKALQELCFSELAPSLPVAAAHTVPLVEQPQQPAPISCSSSACSASGNLSDTGSSVCISTRKVSRQGRASQRWSADPASKHSAIRLTTGSVPICKGGKVLFVSASNKPSWIFPKGGWERDESMEESAIRESFEEAGVVGVLGPRLSEIQYETRKAKKRRLESEELLQRTRQKVGLCVGVDESSTTSSSVYQQHSLGGIPDPLLVSPKTSHESVVVAHPVVIDAAAATSTTTKDDDSNQQQGTTNTAAAAHLSDEAFAQIRAEMLQKKAHRNDETSSVQSDSSGVYTQVRMTLFPLYVSSVKEEWPEGGRLRKAVPIDEAIDMLESRPELQAALKEVKLLGLHLRDPN